MIATQDLVIDITRCPMVLTEAVLCGCVFSADLTGTEVVGTMRLTTLTTGSSVLGTQALATRGTCVTVGLAQLRATDMTGVDVALTKHLTTGSTCLCVIGTDSPQTACTVYLMCFTHPLTTLVTAGIVILTGSTLTDRTGCGM
jgi:hypothetical protein